MVFPPPGTHTILCDFHVKQSWHRTVNSSEYNVGKKEERVCISVSECIKMLAAIADSTDMDAADAATEVFEGYLTDSKNEKLVVWWPGEWSNCVHMWCKAYRQTYFTRDMNTNNPNESTNRAVKYYIQDRGTLRCAPWFPSW